MKRKLIKSHRREVYAAGETFIVNIEESKTRYYISIRRYGWEFYSLLDYKVVKRANNMQAAIEEAMQAAFGELYSEPKETTTDEIEKAINNMNPESVRAYAAKYLPSKYFDEYFTPESAPVEYLRDMLLDYFFKYPGLFPKSAPAPALEELSHTAANIVLTAKNSGEIYRRYTSPLIASMAKKAARGEALEASRLEASAVMRNIISAAVTEIKRVGWDPITAADRKEAACYLAAEYISDANEME